MGEGLLTAWPPFPRIGGVLHCGSVSLADLADQHGTPFYAYDGDRVLDRLAAVREAFEATAPLVAYSVKANPNLALLRLLAAAGAGADIVSGGELRAALASGVPAHRIVFAGVGKTPDEMRGGIEAGIRAFHVESAQELEVLATVAAQTGRAAPVAARVNPDVRSPTHEFTRTGHAGAKFGVSPDEAVELYHRAARDPWLRPVGVDVHIGSQVREPAPFLRAVEVVVEVAERARREAGAQIDYVDMGGGFGISDPFGGELDLTALGRGVAALLEGRGLGLIVEPGRFLVGDAGALVTRVLYVKRSGGKTFVVADAGMTELIRPSHYGGHHAVEHVLDEGRREPAHMAEAARRRGPEPEHAAEAPPPAPETVDLVGPVCEEGDFLARDRQLAAPRPGDLLCVMQAGAYAASMASNYNSRPRAPEVLVRGGRAELVRRRETYADLARGQLP